MEDTDSDYYLNMPSVKRDRLKKLEKKKQLLEMRAALPVYNPEEIRRYKLPYHEAIYLDIEEEGFPTTAAYIRHLIEFHENLRDSLGPEHKVWVLPRLIICKNELNYLRIGLCKAEKAHYEDNIAKEIEELLEISVHFGFFLKDWTWLGEQLFMQTINVASGYEGSNGRHEAVTKYLYAKFLIEHVDACPIAEELLERARKLSYGMHWCAKRFLSTSLDSLYIESTLLLHECFLKSAQACIKTDPKKAYQLAVLARKRAVEACYNEGQVRALLIKGICELIAFDPAEAMDTLFQAFTIKLKYCEQDTCVRKTFEALSLLKQNLPIKALKYLMEVREIANSQHLPYYITQVFRYLGEYYLNRGEAQIATPLFVMALNQFYDSENYEDVEEMRVFGAISTAQELMPEYIKLILMANSNTEVGKRYFKSLLEWKDLRYAFWSNTGDFRFSVIDDNRKSLIERMRASIMYVENKLAHQDTQPPADLMETLLQHEKEKRKPKSDNHITITSSSSDPTLNSTIKSTETEDVTQSELTASSNITAHLVKSSTRTKALKLKTMKETSTVDEDEEDHINDSTKKVSSVVEGINMETFLRRTIEDHALKLIASDENNEQEDEETENEFGTEEEPDVVAVVPDVAPEHFAIEHEPGDPQDHL